MSLEKQKPTLSIIDEGRVWPFFEETGIPISPRKLRCVGPERCRSIQRKGFCSRKSTHHLIFHKNWARGFGYPYDQLVENNLLKVDMAECRHNYYESGDSMFAIHAQYDRAHIPDREMAFRFIDESRLLMSALSSAVGLGKLKEDLGILHRHRNQITDTEYLDYMADKVFSTADILNHKLQQFSQIEVIPERMVSRALNDIMHKRAEIRAVFATEPRTNILPIREAAVEVGLALVA